MCGHKWLETSGLANTFVYWTFQYLSFYFYHFEFLYLLIFDHNRPKCSLVQIKCWESEYKWENMYNNIKSNVI